MKKAGTILFSAIYVLLIVGIVKSEHHCMGHVKSMKYFSTTAEKCFEGEDKRDMSGCCSDETEVISLDDDQHQSQFNPTNHKILYVLRPITSAVATDLSGQVKEEAIYSAYDPPPPSQFLSISSLPPIFTTVNS